MGDNPLTQQQSDQLQSAIKAEVAANTMDDTDLFRPADEWTQMVTDHEQNVLQAASGFLTPVQLGTLQSLEGKKPKTAAPEARAETQGTRDDPIGNLRHRPLKREHMQAHAHRWVVVAAIIGVGAGAATFSLCCSNGRLRTEIIKTIIYGGRGGI